MILRRIFFLLAAFFVAVPVVGAVLLSDKAIAAMTRAELVAVEAAFRQSTFYKYYESLVAGRDKIKVDKITRLKQETRADGKTIVFCEVAVTMTIEGVEFKRIIALEVDVTVKVANPRKNMIGITGGVDHATVVYSRALFSIGRIDIGAILQAGYSRKDGHFSGGICIFF